MDIFISIVESDLYEGGKIYVTIVVSDILKEMPDKEESRIW